MPKFVNQKTHEQQKLRYNQRARKFAYNSWGRWSDNDKSLVLAHVMADSVLSKKIGRSIQAIQAVRNREAAKGGIYV